jgi:hypothetical protein
MAAVPVTISGVVFPKGKSADDKPIPCTIVGYAWVTGLGVGGGPVFPATPPPGGGGEHPAHPIVLPPTEPPTGGPPGAPTHPIVLPEPPDIPPPEIPSDPGMVKPPPPEGGWGWSPVYGWGYFPGTGGPGPKRGR